MELDKLMKGSDTHFQKIVFEHNDHSNIYFDCAGLDDWKICHHKVTIKDVILQMIASGELNKHVLMNSDNGIKNKNGYEELGVDGGTSLRLDKDNKTSPLGIGHKDTMATRNNDSDNDNDHSEYDESDSFKDPSDDDAVATKDNDSDYEDNHSEYDESDYRKDSSPSDDDAVATKYNNPEYDDNQSQLQQTKIGTAATITDIVYCCIYTSAACAMRYNKRSLRTIEGIICEGPLTETSLGLTLRTRPTPMPNRALDVNLCYLWRVLKSNPILHKSILDGTRCESMLITTDEMTDIMFQIIVFRYTGRIYRYEQFRKEQDEGNHSNSNSTTENQPIPVRDTLGNFLNHVKLNLNLLKNRNQMSDWISKQHDGAISPDCVRNFVTFG
jgi:hypothetical protein